MNDDELTAEQVLGINRQHELGRTPKEIATFLDCKKSEVLHYLNIWGYVPNKERSSDNEWTDYR
jgi:hypothetical protein